MPRTRMAQDAGERQATVGAGVYGGLFLTTLSTLTYEILLTRIFSVTMWYHFAFVAVSLALFGMTAGALLVHLLPQRFPPELTKRYLFYSTLLFSLTIVASFILHLQILISSPASRWGSSSRVSACRGDSVDSP